MIDEDMILKYEPNECTYAAMEESKKDEGIYGPFDSVSELMWALDN